MLQGHDRHDRHDMSRLGAEHPWDVREFASLETKELGE